MINSISNSRKVEGAATAATFACVGSLASIPLTGGASSPVAVPLAKVSCGAAIALILGCGSDTAAPQGTPRPDSWMPGPDAASLPDMSDMRSTPMISWRRPTDIDPLGNTNSMMPFVLESDKRLHLAWRNNQGIIAYARSDEPFPLGADRNWEVTRDLIVTADPDSASKVSMDVHQGAPHFLYMDSSDPFNQWVLMHAFVGQGLQKERVPNVSPGVGRQSSMVLSAEGALHIALTGGSFLHSIFKSHDGTWRPFEEIARSGGTAFRYPDIARDRFNNPVIGFYHVTEDAMKVAVNDQGQWTASTFASGIGLGMSFFVSPLSLAVDGRGKIHAVTVTQDPADPAKKTISYATNKDGNGEAWSTKVIASGMDVVFQTSMDLDEEGNPFILYVMTGGVLHLTTNASGAFVDSVVDTQGDRVSFPAIQAGLGKVHIAYRASSNTELLGIKYLVNNDH